jgi:membrane dipeptidase
VIVDLHAHFPMNVPGTLALADRVTGTLIRTVGRIWNDESWGSGPRVTVPRMREGGVGVALSVLYTPFEELFDVTRPYQRWAPYGSAPRARYLRTLLRQLEAVELAVAERHRGEAVIARTPAELDAAIADGRTALVHCVEGGFHLGTSPEAVDAAVSELAGRGVAYITLAHLFWRQIATNTPALPFLPDALYKRLFPQPDTGLTELGHAAVRSMVREHVLIDVSHMTGRALADTFALLDELDPERSVPLIASHVAYRFGDQEYNLDEQTVKAIAARGGLIGLILSEHQTADAVPEHPTHSFDDTHRVLRRHIDRIQEITGSHRHTALGTDLDGFIKPTLSGLENSSKLGRLESALTETYDAETATMICSDNALRLLRSYWRGAS